MSTSTDTATGTLAQRRADALVVMPESFVANGPAARRGGDRHLVTVHAGAEVLAGGGPGRCEIDGGPALAAETARRLRCDASLVGIVEDGDGNPLALPRLTPAELPSWRPVDRRKPHTVGMWFTTQ